jgi:hypothetical protein
MEAAVNSPRTPGGSFVPPHVQELLDAQRRGLEEQNQLLLRHRGVMTPRGRAPGSAGPTPSSVRHIETQTPVTGKRKVDASELSCNGSDGREGLRVELEFSLCGTWADVVLCIDEGTETPAVDSDAAAAAPVASGRKSVSKRLFAVHDEVLVKSSSVCKNNRFFIDARCRNYEIRSVD